MYYYACRGDGCEIVTNPEAIGVTTVLHYSCLTNFKENAAEHHGLH